MKFRLTAVFLFAFGLYAQQTGPPGTFMVSVDPSGACSIGSALQYNVTNGDLSGCKNGTWSTVSGGGGGGAAWGSITGTLTDQTDLNTALGLKVPTSRTVAGHALSGNVTVACGDLSNAAASCSTDATNASNLSSGTLPAARLPNPSATTLGGVESIATATHNFMTGISTAGVPSKAQPACADLSDAAASCNTDATNASNLSSGTINNARLPSAISITGPISLTGSGTGAIDLATGTAPTAPAAGQISIFFNSANSNHLSTIDSSSTVIDIQGALAKTLTSGNIFVGNGSNVATGVAVSGDATLANTGAFTVNKLNGTSAPTNSAADQFLGTTASATGAWASVPNCGDSSHALAYNTTTHLFSCQNVTGGASSPPVFPVNAQTSTYTVTATDFTNCKAITVASGTFTATLTASGSQPSSGQCVWIINYGSGVVTIARSGQNINGGTSSLTLAAGSATAPTGAFVVSDGTNYFAQTFGGGGAVSSVGGQTGVVPGGWILQEQHTASSSAELDFTTCISATYDDYVIRLSEMIPATNNVFFQMQVSTNGGSTYDTANNYRFAAANRNSNGGAGGADSSGTSNFQLGDSIDNTTVNGGYTGTVDLFAPGNGASWPKITQRGIYPVTGIMVTATGGGGYLSATAVNAFRFKFSSGNIASGVARCYGVAKQ